MTLLKLYALALIGASTPFAWKGWSTQSPADMLMACVLALAALGLAVQVACLQKACSQA